MSGVGSVTTLLPMLSNPIIGSPSWIVHRKTNNQILAHKSKAQQNSVYIVFIICCTLSGNTTLEYVPNLTRATVLRSYIPYEPYLVISMLRYVALRLSRAQQRAQHLKYQDVRLLRDIALLLRLLNGYWYESSI